MVYRFHDTAHIEKRAGERGFTVEQVMPVRLGLWLFFRAFESRILVVVAEVKANECWIITGYWEERP